ncbi:histone H1.5-like [Carcharodon carcharias]|uniref:histone H1.5-like n=1 Tax=Carcharodon carcharias TaxID=13397 RepID=UPI001B7E9BCB|nr:histone H1.5-like [Carcharodon carcharias]
MASGDLLEGPSRGRKARRRRSPAKMWQAAAAGGAPTMAGHILEVVASSRERRGLSLAGVKKALSAAGYDVPRINSRVNQAVRSLVAEGSLLQTAGAGASGPFKVNRQQLEGQSRPAAAPAPAPTRKARGRQGRAAAGRKGKVKRSPARVKEKEKPGGRRKGGAGPRKVSKGSGVRRPRGRPRKAAEEPAPGADPAAGEEGEPEAGAGNVPEGNRPRGKTVKEGK